MLPTWLHSTINSVTSVIDDVKKFITANPRLIVTSGIALSLGTGCITVNTRPNANDEPLARAGMGVTSRGENDPNQNIFTLGFNEAAKGVSGKDYRYELEEDGVKVYSHKIWGHYGQDTFPSTYHIDFTNNTAWYERYGGTKVALDPKNFSEKQRLEFAKIDQDLRKTLPEKYPGVAFTHVMTADNTAAVATFPEPITLHRTTKAIPNGTEEVAIKDVKSVIISREKEGTNVKILRAGQEKDKMPLSFALASFDETGKSYLKSIFPHIIESPKAPTVKATEHKSPKSGKIKPAKKSPKSVVKPKSSKTSFASGIKECTTKIEAVKEAKLNYQANTGGTDKTAQSFKDWQEATAAAQAAGCKVPQTFKPGV